MAGPVEGTDQAEAGGSGLTIPEIRKAILTLVDAELRSLEIGRLANAMGGMAEALAHAIVLAAQGDRVEVQKLLHTTARIIVTRANAVLEVVKVDGPVN